ncbi:MAG: T9SS type A sorting domain-containing protein [Bacteroidota bacterium]
MKKALRRFLFFFLLVAMVQQQSTACNASISGPSGRCATTPGTAITYTGTHNFTSSGCTFYEWTITGGTITGPGGVAVTNGTLCVTENVSCASSLAGSCDAAALSTAVAGGNGASVSVVWDAGVQGSLRLRVRERGTIAFSASDDLSVDLRLEQPTSVTIVSQNNTSGTYRANFSEALCPGTSVRWTVNGSFAGTGNPRNLSVGACSNAQICATAVQGGTSSAVRCRSFSGGSLSYDLFGWNTATVNSLVDFSISSTQPMSNINWFTSPPNSAVFILPPSGDYVELYFTNSGYLDVCVDVTTVCGQQFLECKTVNVTNFIPQAGEDPIKEQATENAQLREEPSSQPKTTKSDQVMKVRPTLVHQQQDLIIELPQGSTATQIDIIDINGRLVSSQTTQATAVQLSTQALSPGTYFISAQTSQWRSTQKIVVQ